MNFLKRVSLLVLFFFAGFFLLIPKSYAVTPTQGSWTLLGLDGYIIHSFAVDPNNPTILYAGTAGNGIFKSTDGGDTWNAINNGITNYAGYFTEIVVDPTESNVVYAGGVGVDDGNTGILKSTNGGASWIYSHNGITDVGFGGAPRDIFSMVMDSSNHNILYAALGWRCGSVYKTTNAAGLWTRGIGLPCDPTVVRIDPFNSDIIYTRSAQGINKSIDGGVNWNPISNFGDYFVFYGLAIDPFNSNNLYVNTDTGLYKSTDSGVNWTISNGALNNVYKALVSDPVRPNTVYAGENAGIETSAYVTTNGGSTWTDITNGLPNVGVKRLFVPENNPNVLYTTTDSGIYIYGLTPFNEPPTIGTFTVSHDPQSVNSNVNISATFSDPNVTDTHTAVWNWGDNTTSNGVVTESNGTGVASGTHIYTSAGVYAVNLIVTDNQNNSANAVYNYIVVYDPSAGFITGSGKYSSLAGWDLQDTQASGDVKFGIQAKYLNGNAPQGNTKWNFKNGNLDFVSTFYQWLVVSGNKATLKGNGTINGSGNYTFLTTVIDGSQTGGQDLIRFQIKDSTNTTIYDSQLNQADTSNPTTQLTSGSVKVH